MHAGGRDPWMNERGRPPYPPRRYGDDGPPPPEFGYRDPDRPPVCSPLARFRWLYGLVRLCSFVEGITIVADLCVEEDAVFLDAATVRTK